MRVLRGDDKARLGDIWHVDELFITIRGERHYLTRATERCGTKCELVLIQLVY